MRANAINLTIEKNLSKESNTRIKDLGKEKNEVALFEIRAPDGRTVFSISKLPDSVSHSDGAR